MRWTSPNNRKARCAGLLFVSILSGTAEAAAQARIKLGTLAPTGTSYHRILLEMRDELRVCPNGAIQLSVYPGGVLGSEPVQVRKMRIGQINAALLTAAGLGSIDPSVNVFQKLPLMFHSLDEVDYVRAGLDSVLAHRLKQKGFVALFWGDAGWIRIFSRERALTPAELKQLKIFVGAGDADQIDLMRRARLQVVPMELTDVLTALRTGILDALPTLPFHALAAQFYTTTHHMIELNWMPMVGAMVVTKELWSGLAPADRQCLQLAARRAGDKIKTHGRRESDEAVAAMRDKHGLQVHAVSPELEAAWRAEAMTFWPEIRGSLVPAEIFDEVERLLAEYRSLHAGVAQ